MTKHANPIPYFNAELHLKELNDKFGRLIKNFGANNKKGSERYNLEVNFAYAMHEIQQSPPYMQGKMFDKATNMVSRMIGSLRADTPVQTQEEVNS